MAALTDSLLAKLHDRVKGDPIMTEGVRAFDGGEWIERDGGIECDHRSGAFLRVEPEQIVFGNRNWPQTRRVPL
jgi:hypothetical protein